MRSLPKVVSAIPNDLRAFVDRVREYLGEGSGDRFVTLNELRKGGIVGTTPGGTIIPPGNTGVENPTVPTGLTATGALANIILTWDAANYLGHSYTEVWAAATNDFAAKELVGMAPGTVFSHNIGSSAARYYWIRHVNALGVAGPYNSTTGTFGITGSDPAYLLDVLAGAITDAELSTALNTQIDTNTTQITSVRNLYTVKMDNAGNLAGFGLMSTLADGGAAVSDFFISADRFAVTAPNTSIPTRANTTAYAVGAVTKVASSSSKMLVAKTAGTTSSTAPNISATAIGALVTDGTVVWQVASRVPLAVTTSALTINGTTFAPGVYIDGASIVNATITNASIANLAVDTAKISDVSADKLTAGTMQVGSYIQSQSYVAGTSGWKINSDGSAEFSNVTVRGTVAGSTILGGSATTYASGTGLFAGLDASTYKFRVGNPSGNRLQWTGSALNIVGTITGSVVSGSELRTGLATGYTTGAGFWTSGTQWRVGDPAGSYIRWTGSALEINGEVVGAANMPPRAVNRAEVVSQGLSSATALPTVRLFDIAQGSAATVATVSITPDIAISGTSGNFIVVTMSLLFDRSSDSADRGIITVSRSYTGGTTVDLPYHPIYTINTGYMSTTQFVIDELSGVTIPAGTTITYNISIYAQASRSYLMAYQVMAELKQR